MGTEMIAFIEYDKSELDEDFYNSVLPAPFASDIFCTSQEEGLYTGSKDYSFFKAIAGVRCTDDFEPLIKPRGLPVNKSVALQMAVEKDVFDGLTNIGWLTLAEIEKSLSKAEVLKDDLNFESLFIIESMAMLEDKLGVDRVRLVFGFE